MATRSNRPSQASFAEKPGDRIGRYKLLQEIGEGGFGTVWMAEQEEPVRRRVALKILKPGMDTKTGDRSLRGRASSSSADGPCEHRQSPGWRRNRRRAPLFRHGARQGRSLHRVLRPREALHPRATRSLLPGVFRCSPRSPKGNHPPRPQALEHLGGPSKTQNPSPR